MVCNHCYHFIQCEDSLIPRIHWLSDQSFAAVQAISLGQVHQPPPLLTTPTILHTCYSVIRELSSQSLHRLVAVAPDLMKDTGSVFSVFN